LGLFDGKKLTRILVENEILDNEQRSLIFEWFVDCMKNETLSYYLKKNNEGTVSNHAKSMIFSRPIVD
jgi:hypothetical protein